MEARAALDDDQARYPNSDEAAHRRVHEHPDERMLAPVTDHVLRAAALARADRVLDIGSGAGPAMRTAGRTSRARHGPGGAWLESRAWLVTAHNPQRAEGDPQ